MSIKDFLLNLLLDSVKIPVETVQDLAGRADLDADGYITLRELYTVYKRWKNGESR